MSFTHGFLTMHFKGKCGILKANKLLSDNLWEVRQRKNTEAILAHLLTICDDDLSAY